MINKSIALTQFKRVLWHFNRSPLGLLHKRFRRMFHANEIKKRRNYLDELPFNENINQHVNSIKANGYAIVNDIMEQDSMDAISTASVSKLSRVNKISANNNSRKDFWVRLLDEDMEDGSISIDNPFVGVALQPKLLSIIAHSIGELPRLDYVLLTLSKGSKEEHKISQLWHRDHDDTRVIKFFIYLTDATDIRDGPFTFIPKPQSEKVGYKVKSHCTDDELLKDGLEDSIIEIKAPRLSAFIVDTSKCFHMGSRCFPGHERLLYTATFISIPRLFPEPKPFFKLTGNESELLKDLLL